MSKEEISKMKKILFEVEGSNQTSTDKLHKYEQGLREERKFDQKRSRKIKISMKSFLFILNLYL